MSFSFNFGDDDSSEDEISEKQITNISTLNLSQKSQAAETGTLRRPSSTAFPTGQNLLPPTLHTLSSLLSTLPERISYSTLNVNLPSDKNINGKSSSSHRPSNIKIPRRELWDVRVQIMAEDDIDPQKSEKDVSDGEGLGQNDIKTGVYEGGFKSWECSVDLVKLLSERFEASFSTSSRRTRERNQSVLEMGCGTALPSLALLQWLLMESADMEADRKGVEMWLADYNPSVLRLVTVPNILLSWALNCSRHGEQEEWEDEGELEINPELLARFQKDMDRRNISLKFLSGTWGHEFVDLFRKEGIKAHDLLVLAAETIYSPAALRSFGETLMQILQHTEGDGEEKATALIGAKKVYFGVGGSMEDFVTLIDAMGGRVDRISEEEGGVRREIVEVFGR